MANTYYVNVGGTWKTVSEYYVNVNGTWKTGSIIQANISGDWTADPSVSFPTALDTAKLDYKYFGCTTRVFVDAKAAVSSDGLDNKIWGSRPLWTRSSDFTYTPPSDGGGSPPPNNIPTYDGSYELDLYRYFDAVPRISTASKSGIDPTTLEIMAFECKPVHATKSTFVYSAPSSSSAAASPSILPYKKNLEGLEYRYWGSRPITNVSAKPEIKGGSFDYRIFGCTSMFALPTGAVRTNLALHLDAGDPDSYGGSGTTWASLSNKDTSRSVDFDGSDDRLDIPSSTDFDFGSGDFTIEAWVKTTAGGERGIINRSNAHAGSDSAFIFFITNSGTPYFGVTEDTGWDANVTGTTNIKDGKWNHVAATREGNSLKMYVNGALEATTSWSGSIPASSRVVNIGSQDVHIYMDGSISNVRIVKGTAVYTSAFTPSTEPLTNISDTKLLCCNNPSVTGATVTPGTITANSSPIASGANPFEPYGTIDGATYDGSGDVGGLFDFDGSNDTISISDHVSLEPKNIDWTFESWINVDSSASNYNCLFSKNAGAIIIHWKDNQIKLWANDTASTSGFNITELSTGSNTLATNGWHHVVVSRASNVWKIYIDKVEKATTTVSFTVADATTNAYIGSFEDQNHYFKGMMAQVRIYNNKGLSSSEVTQNYEETKHIFGV